MGVSRPEDAGPFGPVPLRGKVTVRALVRSAWHDAPQVLRSLARRVWAAALAGMAALIAVDIAGGWDRLPFVTNLLSEAISAMVALPIALLIVSRIAAYQVEEANRPRLEARIQASRVRLLEAVDNLLSHIVSIDEEATAAADDLAGAVDVETGPGTGPADLDEINKAAWAMHWVMDNSASEFFHRLVGLVRDYGNHLRSALDDRSLDNAFAGDSPELTQLLSNLEAVVANHRRLIAQGQQQFGRRPALAGHDRQRAPELRNLAMDYLESISRIHQVCIELRQYAERDLSADVTP